MSRLPAPHERDAAVEAEFKPPRDYQVWDDETDIRHYLPWHPRTRAERDALRHEEVEERER